MTSSPVLSAPVGEDAGRPEAPPLTLDQFVRVSEWVYRRTGIRFGPNKRYFVDKRVQACVRQHGGNFEAWFTSVRAGACTVSSQRLINELTVNETYFLREDRQFDALVDSVLPRIRTDRRNTGDPASIRILSLPCATGEEPYSIGIELLERWPDIAEVDVEIVGADIDTRVLEQARRGEYGERSLQRVPPAVRSRWFERTGPELFRIKPELRDAIEFSLANICESDAMRSFRDFDVVFCRNLLIYFDELSTRRAIENLFGVLRPGGYLFLGLSESMSRASSILEPVRLAEGIVYRRPRIGSAS